MSLSSDLLSQFVKITKDEPKTKSGATVYGTTVIHNGVTYVKLDGSDSDVLTPVTTAASVQDGERVTVTIKDHTATITGNMSSPSARSGDVEDTNVKITELGHVVANKATIEQLEVERARIDAIVAGDVTVQGTLSANAADIVTLKADDAIIKERLTAAEAEIDSLDTTKLDASIANITYATISELEATNADIHNLEATYAAFETATANKFTAANASIADLDAAKLDASEARITYATIAELNAFEADISKLEANVADIDTLIFGSATGSTIQTSFANAVIAQLGNAQIKAAMIESVSANKITAGDINTNNVRVKSQNGLLLISDETIQISDEARVRVQIGKDAAGDYSINIWDANGNLMFSEGGITDSAIKDAIIRNDMVSDTANIAAHKLDIDSLFEEINGSTNTIKSTRIYLDDQAQTLDVAFKELETEVSELGDTVSSHGTQISVIQGQISSKVWQQDINNATGEMSTQYSAIEQQIDGINATVASYESRFANYPTTLEMEAAIELSEDAITSSVSKTYTTKTEFKALEIGGRNLIKNGDFTAGLNKWVPVGITCTIEEDDKHGSCVKMISTEAGSSNSRLYPSTTDNFVHTGGKYTLSFYAKADAATTMQTNVAGGSAGVGNYDLTTSWKKFVHTYEASAGSIAFWSNEANTTIYLTKIKLEHGEKATDWTPAPEDMATEGDVKGIQSNVDSIDERVFTTESLIQQLSNSIAMLVTDANGASLMTQTETGWTFSTADIQSAVTSAAESLDSLTNELGNTNSAVDVLQQAVADLGEIAEYVKIGTYEDEPCIELGESDSEFKMRITNTRILFMEGSNVVAHISNQSLHIKKAIIEEELQQGDFVWQIRSNGNLGLIWKG